MKKKLTCIREKGRELACGVAARVVFGTIRCVMHLINASSAEYEMYL